VLCAHYPREDALLVAACDLVPRSRASARAWRAQLPAFLGFYQWQRARAAAHAAALAEAEALGASGGDEGASEELGAAAPADARSPLPPPPSRTNWTRLVHPSVLTGHVSSLSHR
jgi:hypothetical protein